MNQPGSSRVILELQGHVLLLGLERVAKRTAFDLDLLSAPSLAYGEFDRNDEARVVVVFAHGEHFTAGLDLANVGTVMAAGWQPPLDGCDPWGVFAGRSACRGCSACRRGRCPPVRRACKARPLRQRVCKRWSRSCSTAKMPGNACWQ